MMAAMTPTDAGRACPYLVCRGEWGHPGPHLFEQPDIEKLKREAAAAEWQRWRVALGNLRPIPTNRQDYYEGWDDCRAALVASLAEPTPKASDACPICGWVHTAEQGHVVDGKNA